MAYDITQAERIEVGTAGSLVPFGTSCCETDSSLAILWAGNPQRGENRPIPGVDGVDEREAVLDQARKLVAGWIYGFVDWDGAEPGPGVTIREQLQANVKHVLDTVVEPIGATRTARLYLPDGTYREKPVQVKDWVLTAHTPSSARWVLDLNFTKGIFEL